MELQDDLWRIAMKPKQVLTLLALAAVLATTVACNANEFTRIGDESVALRRTNLELPDPCDVAQPGSFDCLLLMDSFERDIDKGPGVGGDFVWRTLVDDAGRLNGESVEANIYRANELGPTPEAVTGSASDKGRSLVFTGRPGGSVHSVYLVSKSFDVRDYESITFLMDYLAIGLESWNWRDKGGNEHIRLDICEHGRDACGAGSILNEGALNSDNWTIARQSPANIGQGLNRDHSLSDWSFEEIQVDISELSQQAKQNFAFRIVVTIDEGFLKSDIASGFEDAVALDNIVAIATKIQP